jgi:hypothetical protein
VSASTLRARFPPTVWRPPRGRAQDHMARTRSAGAEAAAAQAATPPLVSEPTNPCPSAVQPSAGTGAGLSAPEVEHTASGMFEVSLEGLGLQRKTSRLSEGSGPSSLASPGHLIPSRRRAHPPRRGNLPSTRTRLRRTPSPMPSTSTSGRLSVTSPCCKARSPA